METKVQLEKLYTAGNVSFPDHARSLAETVRQLETSGSAWEKEEWGAGSPTSLTRAIAINVETHARLRRAVGTWNDASIALVAIAELFQSTDAGAADAFLKLDKDITERPEPLPEIPPKYERDQ